MCGVGGDSKGKGDLKVCILNLNESEQGCHGEREVNLNWRMDVSAICC